MTSIQSRSDSLPKRAKYACVWCTKRKKGCDKRLPQCSHCQKRGADCEYAPIPQARTKFVFSPLQGDIIKNTNVSTVSDTPALSPRSSDPVAQCLSLSECVELLNPRLSICRRICEILEQLGSRTDELCPKYFYGLYTCFPFISKESFYRSLEDFPASQDADVGLLLLVVCLTARQEPIPRTGAYITQRSFYITTKVLVAQMQACLPPSSRMIQAGALLAMYEYVNRKCDEALATLSSYIRLAYTIGLDNQRLPDAANGDGRDRRSERQERNNLWWMLVICERLFVVETSNPDQPLITPFPDETRAVPSDHYAFLNVEHNASSFTAVASFTHISAFGRMAQATELLDTVLKCRADVRHPPTQRAAELARIDSDLQSLLSIIMERNRSSAATFCGSFAINIRAMFVFHRHILRPDSDIFRGGPARIAASKAVLDTATNMLIQIATSHKSYAIDPEANVDTLPPTCVYSIDSAKEHMRERSSQKWKAEECEALDIFRAVLTKRWSGI